MTCPSTGADNFTPSPPAAMQQRLGEYDASQQPMPLSAFPVEQHAEHVYTEPSKHEPSRAQPEACV